MEQVPVPKGSPAPNPPRLSKNRPPVLSRRTWPVMAAGTETGIHITEMGKKPSRLLPPRPVAAARNYPWKGILGIFSAVYEANCEPITPRRVGRPANSRRPEHFMKWNLKNRILVPTVALIVLITLAISIVSFRMSQSSLSAAMDSQLQGICASTVNQIETWVGGQRQFLAHWSVQPGVVLAVQNGAEATNARATLSAQLSEARRQYPFYEHFYLVDSAGNAIASSNPDIVGKLNVADRQYFKDAIAGQASVSEVIKSKVTGSPVVAVSFPVRDGDAVKGVLFGTLDLNWFSDKFVSQIKVLDTGYAFLFDEKGVFIAHPDKTKIFQTKLADFDWGTQVQTRHNGGL